MVGESELPSRNYLNAGFRRDQSSTDQPSNQKHRTSNSERLVVDGQTPKKPFATRSGAVMGSAAPLRPGFQPETAASLPRRTRTIAGIALLVSTPGECLFRR